VKLYPNREQVARAWAEITFDRALRVAWLLVGAAFVEAIFEFPERLPQVVPDKLSVTVDGELNLLHDGAVALSHDGSVEVTK